MGAVVGRGSEPGMCCSWKVPFLQTSMNDSIVPLLKVRVNFFADVASPGLFEATGSFISLKKKV